MRLTKTRFVAGVQCPKRLYLMVHSPELAAPADESDWAVIEQGREVGLLAQSLFPGGIAVDCKNREQAIRSTRELIANRDVPAIFEAAFEHDNAFVRVDILQRRRNQQWRLIEVKSSTALKEHHLPDVALQHRVVSRSGVDLAATCLAHVNRSYVHDGGQIDVRRFFTIRNATREALRLQRAVADQLRSELRVLEMPQAPQIPVGRQCSYPVICEFHAQCNPPLPDDHILRLPRMHASTVAKLVADGIQSIHQIPESYPLSLRLRRACNAVQSGSPWFAPELKNCLDGLRYPLIFLDFETVSPAIPRFAGMRPYDHIPFQFSLHIVREADAAPEHVEFLAEDSNDPRPAFASKLCDAVADQGMIVVYHQQFERQRLADLSAWLPEFSGRMEKIQQRLFDLLPIIRDHCYHPAFNGSFSLKRVLPGLVPEMTYDGMEVADGKAAGLAWESLISGDCSEAERQRKRKALLDYCGQDTLAMIRLLETLQRVSA